MKFQIAGLMIWPKRTKFQPKTIRFDLGKVNIITGASRTGKSAIIPIIDYCLGSTHCSIPIEVIRDNASWYGVIIATDDEKILFARKAPEGVQASQECFVIRGQNISVPAQIASKNQNVDGVKQILDDIANVPYFNRDENGVAYNDRLSFRDLTHLVFQSQDIVANQNILFYKTHETEHREKLRNWFPFILGAETAEAIQARQELKEIEKDLSRRQREYERAKSVANDWLQSLVGQINVAKEYGLYSEDLPSQFEMDTLILIAKNILASEPQAPKTTTETLSEARIAISKCEDEENELSKNIALLQNRLKDIERLEKSLSGFQSSTRRKVERLGISSWIKANAQNVQICPVCGSTEHPMAQQELDKICSALQQYEAVSVAAPLPAAFAREKTDLKSKLNELLEAKNALQQRFDVLRARDKEAALHLQRTKDMFLFLGQLKSTVDLVERLSGTGGLEDKIRELEERQARLNQIISVATIRNLTDRALREISSLTLERLKTLDADDSYKKTPPEFSITELGMKVMGQDGTWHLLGEVGSASNWVAFHLAFTCALQEYFTSMENPVSSVPSFVVYDQPSQVYFPKIRRTEQEDDPQYQDEDVASVKQMFATISESIKSTQGQWQAIILDHAGSDIYGDIDGVVEKAVWRNGEKLIPEKWYKVEKQEGASNA